MMRQILVVAVIITFFLTIWCIVAPAINSYTEGYNFIDLNFPKAEKEYQLKKGYKLLFNKDIQKYKLIVPDAKYPSLDDLSIMLYPSSGMNSEIWTTSDEEDTKLFTDSAVAKHFAHVWYDRQVRYKREHNFK